MQKHLFIPFIYLFVHSAFGFSEQILTLTKTQDMSFGTAVQGAPAKTTAPSSSETAKFTVLGEPYSVVSIQIPGNVTMMNSGKNANEEIDVSNFFTSTPILTLDGSGSGSFYVGATRTALQSDHTPGSYMADSTVYVAYNGKSYASASFAVTQSVISGVSIVATKKGKITTHPGAIFDVSPHSPASARFEIRGEPHRSFAVSFPDSIMLRKISGTQRVYLRALGHPAESGIFDADGAAEIKMGFATKRPIPQLVGRYIGYFTIKSHYDRSTATGTIEVTVR